MRQQLKPLAFSLSLLGIMSLPVFAQADNISSGNMDTISHRENQLENRLSQVQQELRSIKKQLKNNQQQVSYSNNKNTAKQQQPHLIVNNEAQETKQEEAAQSTGSSITGPQNLPEIGSQYIGTDVDAPGQSFVTTGPYIGVPVSYAGNNLIINSPSINEDVSLLKLRKNIRARLRKLGIPVVSDHAHLLLSGIIEGQIAYKNPGVGPTTSDVDLTSAGLDAYVLGPSSWLSGLMEFAYDNDLGTNSGSFNNNSRNQNSRVFINKAFVVIGNFEKSPFYGTIGQMYVPFGTYSSSMVSSPLTKLIARTKDRALLVGFQQQGDDALYGSAYVFKGDSYTGSTRSINNGGVNVGYSFVSGKYSGNFGGGAIANLADSQGMQNTGGTPLFNGFGGTNGTGNEQLAHRVPAMNVRGIFSIGDSWDFIAEYVGAVKSFSRADLTYNTHGAEPQALNVEGAYTFTVFTKPTSLTLDYGKTKDALALGVPLERFGVTLNTSLWKDSLESLEFRHDINYAASSVATGSGIMAPSASGKSDNVVTAQIDMYF